jgi:hypothetical protein
LVEEGFEAVLTRKYNTNSARPRIFDGAAEAKLIALTCGPAPAGHAKWSLRLRRVLRPIVAAFIPRGISPGIAGSCRPTPIPGSTPSTSRIGSRERSRRRVAGGSGWEIRRIFVLERSINGLSPAERVAAPQGRRATGE